MTGKAESPASAMPEANKALPSAGVASSDSNEPSQSAASSSSIKRDIATANNATSTSTTGVPVEESEDSSSPSKRVKVDSTAATTPAKTTSSINSSEAVVVEAVVTPTNPAPAAAAVGVASSSGNNNDDVVIDLAETLGYKPGDRLEVQWEIHNDGNNDNNNKTTASAASTTTKTVWWKATLLEHDGRCTDSVAIRSLLYDARDDLGFPEPSKEDVVFMGHDLLVNPNVSDGDDDLDNLQQLRYKREGLSEEENSVVQCSSDQELDEQLNTIMMGAFSRQQQAWKAMPAAAQAIIAEKMKGMKQKIKQKLQSQAKKGHVITSETIRELLAESF